MKTPLRFFGHFAAAYGTIWMGLLAVAFITLSRIDAGMFGLVGFPIIALVYAVLRVCSVESPEARITRLQAHIRSLWAVLEHQDELQRRPLDVLEVVE